MSEEPKHPHPHILDCVICGREFNAKASNAKYCSDNCRGVIGVARLLSRFLNDLGETLLGMQDRLDKLEKNYGKEAKALPSDLADATLRSGLEALMGGHQKFTHTGSGVLFLAHKLPEENADVNEKRRRDNDELKRKWEDIQFQLSVRAVNLLNRLNIRNLPKLLGYSRGELYQEKNCGAKTIKQIEDVLNSFGHHLRCVG